MPEPARLRQLRVLVTVLTATMILGLIIILTLVVITFTQERGKSPLALPDTIALPEGMTATQAVTFGAGWIGLVTQDETGALRFVVFDAETGALRKTVLLEP